MTLESLQKRIKTTQDLRNIVSTMKALSSVSILQYDEAALSLKGYQKNIRDAFHAMIKRGDLPSRLKPAAAGKTLIILVGTDSGLVGRFNTEIVKKALLDLQENKTPLSDTLFLTVGKRMMAAADSHHLNIFAKYAISNSIKVVNSLAGTLIIKIFEAMQSRKVTNVLVYYHKREQASATTLEKMTLLPFDEKNYERLRQKPWKTNNIPLITMKPKALLDTLIKEYLMIQMCAALTYSLASEHHTRMVNMQNAEKNIDESLEHLNLEYQQKRQDAITEELIDVVSGAQALMPRKQKR